MRSERIPQTDSIRELVDFWDTHDLTDFQDQLEEVQEPVFERGTTLKIQLTSEEATTLAKMAESKGRTYDALIHEWTREKAGLL